MAGNIKGITIEFRGDTTKLDKALRQVNQETRSLDSELKKINTALKFNPGNVDLWRQKQDVLKQKIGETEDKLKLLKQQQKTMDTQGVDKNSEEYRQLQRDIVETESKLKTFKGQLKEVGNVKLKAISAQLDEIGNKAIATGKNLTTHLTAPIMAVAGASVKVGLNFDEAMSQVAATMGTTVDQIQDLRDFAKEMGASTKFSATEAAEGLNYMALAGYDAETSMKMLPIVLNLAAAGSMELAAASDMVTDAQSALGLSIEETEVMVDQMAKTASTTNTSVEQLGSAYLTVGGTAKILKGGTQELSTVLGLLADNGIKGSEGGTALRNILLSLSAPTDKAAAELQKLGVNAFDADGNLRPLEDTFADLNAVYGTMTDEMRTQSISTIFNKRDIKGVNALLGTSADRWDEVSGAIGDANGAAQQMADTQLDNLAGSLTILKSSLEGAAIAISDVLAPWIRKLADFIQGLVERFNNLSPEQQKIIVGIGLVVAAIGPLLLIIGKVMAVIGTIMSVMAAVTAPMIAIVAGIAAVVAALVLAYKNSETFRDAVGKLGSALSTLLGGAIAFLTPILKTLGAILGIIWSIFKKVAEVLGTVLAPVITVVAKAIDAIGKTFQWLGKVIQPVVNVFKKIQGVLESLGLSYDTVSKKIRTAGATLAGPFIKAKETIDGAIKKVKGWFPFNIGKILDLKIPHIKLSGGKAPWGIAGKGKLPSFSVNWYKTGGIFDSPSLIGVGEAGAEAVVPLDQLYSRLDRMADNMGKGTNVTYNITVDGATDPAQFAEQLVRSLKMKMRTA